MAKKPTVNLIGSGYASKDLLNNNFEELRDAFDNTLSLDGSTPNAMGADLDMNSNDILNVGSITANALSVDGKDINALAAQAEASAASAEASAAAALDLVIGVDPISSFDTIAHMAASDGFLDGQHAAVWGGFNGEPETFRYDASSPLTADGALVVNATGMGAGRLVSTRTVYADFDEFIGDVRTFDAGVVATIYGITATYTATDGAGNLGQTGAGGQEWDVWSITGDIRAWGAKGDGATDSTDAINAAIEYSSVTGSSILVPVGRFLYTKTDTRFDNVTIKGVKRPSYNSNRTALEGGSIIVGTLELKGANPTVIDLGVDHGAAAFPASPDNAIVLAHQNPFTVESIATVSNVIGLCAGVEDPYHAILCEGHYDTNVSNVVGIKSFFGMALKSVRTNVSNAILMENGSDNLIVKSDTTSGKCSKVNINNVVCFGSGTTGAETTSFNVRISAFDNDVDEVNLNNIVGGGASYIIYLDASGASAGTMKQVNINNISGSDVGRVLLIDGGTGTGLIDNVSINQVNVDDVQFRAGEIKGNVGRVSVDNWYSSNILGATLLASTFTVASTVGNFSISNTVLVEDGDHTALGGLDLANSSDDNQISGNNKFNLSGVGVPKEGYSQDTSTGASITLAPVFTTKGRSVISLSASGTRTVVGIGRTMASGIRFPTGYELVVMNNASGTVTLTHDASTYIFNRGSTSYSIAPNEATKYVFGGSIWHQVL